MSSSGIDGSWIEEEIARADFGDLRLNKRFKILSSELASHPSQPINQASTDWAATKAAYRFFGNPKVQTSQILEPHFMNTQLRAKGSSRLIVVQDTSFLDFTRHIKTEGLGRIGKYPGVEPQGLILHCALALSEKGLPLGLLHQKIWPRTRVIGKNSHQESLIPIEKKESFKWFDGLKNILKTTPDHEVVMVCDREGDIYELFEEAMSCGIDFVIRAIHPRMLEDENFGDINLFDRIAVAPVRSEVTVEIPSSGKRPGRKAHLSIKYLPVTYSAHPRGITTKQNKNRSHLELNIVHLFEDHPPKGEVPIHWTLVTTLKIDKLKDALEVIRIYRMRWHIELYFKCLKTGCGIETCRLQDSRKLTHYIALQSIIAWRILWMTFINRTDPTISCEIFLTKSEWQVLWFKKNRRLIKSGKIEAKPPASPPTANEAIRWIAMQGGFLARKGDGDPGQITIWRGWLDLMAAVDLYEVLKTKPTPC